MFKQKPNPKRIDKLEKLSLFQMYSGKTKTKKQKFYNFLWKSFWVILVIIGICIFLYFYLRIIVEISGMLT